MRHARQEGDISQALFFDETFLAPGVLWQREGMQSLGPRAETHDGAPAEAYHHPCSRATGGNRPGLAA